MPQHLDANQRAAHARVRHPRRQPAEEHRHRGDAEVERREQLRQDDGGGQRDELHQVGAGGRPHHAGAAGAADGARGFVVVDGG